MQNLDTHASSPSVNDDKTALFITEIPTPPRRRRCHTEMTHVGDVLASALVHGMVVGDGGDGILILSVHTNTKACL